MKILHLSDLHIGRRLGTISLKEDQEYILKTILAVIDEKGVETVCIAGDVYDKSVPSTEAIKVFEDFLMSLVKRSIKVFIISGNHDSAERLSFANKLISDKGVYIASAYNGEVESITLEDDYGKINFYLLPFVKPLHVAHFYPDEQINTNDYTLAVEVALKHLNINTDERNIILSHQFVTGSEKGGSEITSVGGLDNVDSYVYDDFDYVALGHIHRPQNVKGSLIRYCGTPMKYDFSESTQQKTLTLLDIKDKGNVQFEYVPITSKRDFVVIKGFYEEVMSDAHIDDMGTDHFIHIVLLDEEDIPNAYDNMLKKYPGLQSMEYDNNRTRSNAYLSGSTVDLTLSPMDLISEFFKSQNGGELMSDKQNAYINELLESMNEG